VVCPRRCQDGRRWWLASSRDDPGLNCFSFMCFRVLSESS
jgi:hypothetical protein